MKCHSIVVGVFLFVASVVPAAAATLDLAAMRLVKGHSIARSDLVAVVVDLSVTDTFLADVDDADFEGSVFGTPSDMSASLSLFGPLSFVGDLIAVEFAPDLTSVAGLFFEAGASVYLLAELTLPSGGVFADRLSVDNATAEIFAVARIPLPAAAPLMLAGLGALALAGRRRIA